MIKNKIAKAAIAGCLALAGAIGLSNSAQAATQSVLVNQLNTPGNHGYYHGYINWSASDTVYVTGYAYDTDSDGHGPYLHFVEAGTHGQVQFASVHNTSGAGTSKNIPGNAGTDDKVYWVDAWACNGGTADGYGAQEPYGCYGRRYWNQIIYPGKGSESLGNTNLGVY